MNFLKCRHPEPISGVKFGILGSGYKFFFNHSPDPKKLKAHGLSVSALNISLLQQIELSSLEPSKFEVWLLLLFCELKKPISVT